MPAPGERVPDLPLQLTQGGSARLQDYRGRWLVLYFYPKDSTPGCTSEGNDFNALLPRLRAAGAELLGVSRDPVASHQRFRERQGFDFDLVADVDEAVCRAFGVIGEKSMYGRKVVGVIRSTFLLDPDGVVREVWSPVRVRGHADAVLAALERHAGR